MKVLIFLDVFMAIVYAYVCFLTVKNAIRFWKIEDNVEGQRNAFAIVSLVAVVAIILFTVADLKLNLIPDSPCDQVLPIWKDALDARVANRLLLCFTVIMTVPTFLGYHFTIFTKAFWRKKIKL